MLEWISSRYCARVAASASSDWDRRRCRCSEILRLVREMQERPQPLTSSQLPALWPAIVAVWMGGGDGRRLVCLFMSACVCSCSRFIPSQPPSLPEVSKGLVSWLLGSRLWRRLFAKNKWTRRSRRPQGATWAAKHLSLCLLGKGTTTVTIIQIAGCYVRVTQYGYVIGFYSVITACLSLAKHEVECMYEYKRNYFVVAFYCKILNLPFHLHFAPVFWPPLHHPFAFSLSDWII